MAMPSALPSPRSSRSAMTACSSSMRIVWWRVTLLRPLRGAMRDGFAAVQTRLPCSQPGRGNSYSSAGALYLWVQYCSAARTRASRPLGRSAGKRVRFEERTLKAVPYLASSVVEDLEYHLALIQNGIRVRFIDDTSVFGEMPARGEGVKTQRSRWEGGRVSHDLPDSTEVGAWVSCGDDWPSSSPCWSYFCCPLHFMCCCS